MKMIPVALIALAALSLGACGHMPRVYTGPDHNGQGHKGGDTVLVCHKGKKTMELPRSAAEGHMGHGDRYGRC